MQPMQPFDDADAAARQAHDAALAAEAARTAPTASADYDTVTFPPGTPVVDALVAMAPAVEDEPDELALLPSGRARFVMGGRRYTLRRPTLGELREFRIRLATQAEDNRRDRALRMAAAEADPTTAIDVGDMLDTDERQMLDLLAWVFEHLGDKRLPAERDDLPPWVTDALIPSRLVKHWQTVPLASGA